MKLRDSLTEDESIRPQTKAGTWRETVKIDINLLVTIDAVEPRYCQMILDGVEQFGPHFVITPSLAIPHGCPEEGARRTGFSLATLKEPLEFNRDDNNSVNVLITMATVNASTHQEVGIV